MTIDEARAVIEAITYRPGWVITTRLFNDGLPRWAEGLEIIAKAHVLNAYAAHEQIYVGLTRKLPLWELESMDTERLLLYIFERVILNMEHHEAAEFFQHEGRRIFDPHGARRGHDER